MASRSLSEVELYRQTTAEAGSARILSRINMENSRRRLAIAAAFHAEARALRARSMALRKPARRELGL